MSWFGPMIGITSDVYRRVSRSFSPADSFFGAQTMSPFASPFSTYLIKRGIAAYALAIVATLALVAWSWIAMKRAEKRREEARGK